MCVALGRLDFKTCIDTRAELRADNFHLSKYHARFAIFISMIIAAAAAAPLPIYQVKVWWLPGEKSCLSAAIYWMVSAEREIVIFDAH
jgi:hypothetical protein